MESIINLVTSLILDASILPIISAPKFEFTPEYLEYQNDPSYAVFKEWSNIWEDFVQACREIKDADTVGRLIARYRNNAVMQHSPRVSTVAAR